SMIRDLVGASVRLAEKERIEAVRPEAEKRAFDRLVEMLDDEKPKRRRARPGSRISEELMQKALEAFGARFDQTVDEAEFGKEKAADEAKLAAQRKKRIERDLRAGKLDQKLVEVETEESSNPFIQVFTPQGLEEMGLDSNPGMGPFNGRRS